MQTILIGREAICNIILNDTFVSRRHAQLILLDNGQVLLKDLGSSNGTFVNGTRISECYIKSGDIVKCASLFLNWQEYINSVNVKADHFDQPKPVINMELPALPIANYQSLQELATYRKGTIINPVNTSAFWGSLLVIVGFFLPWIKFFEEINGAHIAGLIAENEGKDSLYSILFYLFPVSATIFIISALIGHVSNFALAVRYIPSILLIILVIVIIAKSGNNYSNVDADAVRSFFQIIGIGFILTVIGAILMCFYPNRSSKNN